MDKNTKIYKCDVPGCFAQVDDENQLCEEHQESGSELTVKIKEVKRLNADSRGRINVGTDYADKELRVAVLEVLNEEG